jgi:hypothetical protein
MSISVLVVQTGISCPRLLLGLGHGQLLVTTRSTFKTRQEYYQDGGHWVSKAARFAGVPEHSEWADFVNYVGLASSMGINTPIKPENPRLLLFVEGSWADDLGAQPLNILLEEVFRIKSWKRYALEKGILIGVMSRFPDTLGVDLSSKKHNELVAKGVDVFFSTDDYNKVGQEIDSAAKLCAKVRSQHALIFRSRKWTLDGLAPAWLLAALVFAAFHGVQIVLLQGAEWVTEGLKCIKLFMDALC